MLFFFISIVTGFNIKAAKKKKEISCTYHSEVRIKKRVESENYGTLDAFPEIPRKGMRYYAGAWLNSGWA